MLKKFEVSGVHENTEILDYINKKIGELDRLMSRHAKKSAHGEVRLSERKATANKFTCHVVFYLPHQTLTAHEAAITFEAAIDQAEDKLKAQLHKYKELHTDAKRSRHLIGRLARVTPQE
jgi:ribosomal subunit interface protein